MDQAVKWIGKGRGPDSRDLLDGGTKMGMDFMPENPSCFAVSDPLKKAIAVYFINK